MLDPSIQDFLAKRKEDWLKEKLKTCKTDEDKREVEGKAEEKFHLENWLPDAAKRSGWLSMISHPAKFTHPSAKTSAVIAQVEFKADGFLRSGNVTVEFDVLGNAAALDVYKFLSLPMNDGQTVLAHLEHNSDTLQQQFTLSTVPFAEIQQGLLAIKQTSVTEKTSEKIKQVYFPVDDDYHLLSILTPSGLMFKLKEVINTLRFSELAKKAREDRRANKHNEQGFDELYNLSVIGFGGANKQNISMLNSQNGGTAYLLPSLPPPLEMRTLRHPQKNFFLESLYFKDYQDLFNELRKVLKAFGNTVEHREARDAILRSIAERIMEKVWQFRHLESNWSEYSTLPLAQKIWLDSAYSDEREEPSDWLDSIIQTLATWLLHGCEKSLGKEKLGDVDLSHIKKLLNENAEDFQ
ncbi:MAG: type I-F CRISPR-associated protein Csy1 [Methylococcaceae bacterium]